MEAYALSVYELFTGDTTGRHPKGPVYAIPQFQRGYAWKREEVDALLEDLKEARKPEVDQYFLGAVTAIVTAAPDGPRFTFRIIDGQQRLTTLQLLALQLLDRLPAESMGLRGRLCNMTGITEEYCPVEHTRPDDRDAFEKVRTDQKSDVGGGHKLIDAYRRIGGFLDGLSKDELTGLGEFLLDRTKVVFIKANDEESCYQIFETLNNRGESLTALDLIRNRLLYAISHDHSLLEKAHNIWHERLVAIQSQTDKRTADTIMQHLFVVQIQVREGDWIETKDLYAAVKRHLKDHRSREAYVFLKELLDENAVKTYIKLHKRNGAMLEANAHYSAEVAEAAEHRIFHPPLFVMLLKAASAVEEIKKAALLFRNFIRRFRLVKDSIPVKRLGRRMAGLAAEMWRLPSEKLASGEWYPMVWKAVKEADVELAGVLNDDAFIEAVMRKPVIKEEYAKRAFIDLVNAKAESDAERLGPSQTLHIEHVLPRKPADLGDWPAFDGTDVSYFIYKFGNMTILGSKLNQSVSNGPFERKKPVYADSNYWVTQRIAEFDEWSPQAIEQRQEELLRELVQVWAVAPYAP